jgi:hypothetical protein
VIVTSKSSRGKTEVIGNSLVVGRIVFLYLPAVTIQHLRLSLHVTSSKHWMQLPRLLKSCEELCLLG